MTGNPNGARLRPSFIKFFKVSLIGVLILGIVLIWYSCQKSDTIDYSQSDFVQLEEPSDDTDVLVFETSEGTFKAVLYEDEAPEYVAYLKELVSDGYFDGTYVCTIIKSEDGLEAGFLGGSKTSDGTTAEESNTDMTDVEISANLLPFKGTLASLVSEGSMFSSSKAGSIITFVGDVVDADELKESVADQEDENGLLEVSDLFIKYGGVPNLMQQYTLFGQVFDGWEAYDKICAAEIVDEGEPDTDSDGNTNEDKNYQPVDEIMINKVYLSTYGEEKTGEWSLPVINSDTTTSEDETESETESETEAETESETEAETEAEE